MTSSEFDYYLLLEADFLTPESIVFDIGANIGVWTQQIYDKYHPKMYCFEPAKSSFNTLRRKFGENMDFKLFRYGLGATDRDFWLFTTNEVSGDASEFLEGKRQRMISPMDGIAKKELCQNIDCILVSFHTPEFGVVVNNCWNRIEKIREGLEKTHACEWVYPASWEKWVKL
jgi:FkbM family methyltransferase